MRRLAVLSLLALACLVPAASASYRAPCIPGESGSPKCTWTEAHVNLVADGDTVEVTIPGQGAQSIRFVGINAMELSRYSHTASKRRGDCHGVQATNFIEKFIKKAHWKIKLASQHTSSRSGHRLRRSVWVESGGHLVDLSKLELQAGLVLWLPNGDEWAHNRDYSTLAEEARAAQRGLYDPESCGFGPSQGALLNVVVNWDADGADDKNLNGEYVDVRNAGATDVPLGGWFVRDSWLRRGAGSRKPGYVFPAGTVVPAGGHIRLHAGCGRGDATTFYWCQSDSVFENAEKGRKDVGDGAYLFDPQGDLRTSMIYPCRVACTDGAAGAIQLIAHPNRPESVTLVNTGSGAVSLSDHTLKLRNHGRANQYVFGTQFPAGLTLQPGDRVRWTPPGPGDRLADSGGVIELRTLDDQLSACVDWGFAHC